MRQASTLVNFINFINRTYKLLKTLAREIPGASTERSRKYPKGV
jgi:hypothetical protein